MSDLQVDLDGLAALARSVDAVPDEVRVESGLTHANERALRADHVIDEFGTGARAQAEVAQVVAESVVVLGRYPMEVADQIDLTEGRLATAALCVVG